MSALYGRLTGDRAKTMATRQGEESIHAALETWDGILVAALERDGTFRVSARAKDAPVVEAVLLGKGSLADDPSGEHGGQWEPNLDARGWLWQPTNES